MRSRHSVNSTLNSFLLFIPISEAIPSQVCVVTGKRSGYHTAGYIQAILPDPPLSSFKFHMQFPFLLCFDLELQRSTLISSLIFRDLALFLL